MKGPEEMEVVAAGVQSALCMCVLASVCAQNVCDRYECRCVCPIGSVDGPVLPTCPCPPLAAKEAEGRGATVGLTFNN